MQNAGIEVRVVCKPNGNLIYTCMSGAYELDEDGNKVWSLEDKDVPGINISAV